MSTHSSHGSANLSGWPTSNSLPDSVSRTPKSTPPSTISRTVNVQVSAPAKPSAALSSAKTQKSTATSSAIKVLKPSSQSGGSGGTPKPNAGPSRSQPPANAGKTSKSQPNTQLVVVEDSKLVTGAHSPELNTARADQQEAPCSASKTVLSLSQQPGTVAKVTHRYDTSKRPSFL